MPRAKPPKKPGLDLKYAHIQFGSANQLPCVYQMDEKTGPTLYTKGGRPLSTLSPDEQSRYYIPPEYAWTLNGGTNPNAPNPFAGVEGMGDFTTEELAMAVQLLRQMRSQREQPKTDAVLEFDLISPPSAPEPKGVIHILPPELTEPQTRVVGRR